VKKALAWGLGGGNEVGYGAPANRHPHPLTATDGPQRLAQRRLEFSHSDLTHVVTLAVLVVTSITS